jgi:hypothetical protein
LYFDLLILYFISCIINYLIGVIMADSVNRIFSMSYADLIRYCDNIHGFMVRDATQFALFGISALLTTGFKTKIDDFIALPQDVALEADEINTTQAKSTLANELRIMLRAFATRAKLAFGETNGNYKRFHSKELSRMPDANLYLFGGVVMEAATDLLTEMASTGLTQDMIDDLTDKNEEFRIALAAQSAAIADRDNAAHNRVIKANELYTLLVRYCDVGKEIWYETNEAYYNDYILYAPSAGSLSAPQGLRFNFSNLAFYWDMVEHASSFQVEASLNGSDYFEIYSGSDLECAYTPVQEGWMWYRVRARNANGFGPYSDVLKAGYYAGIILPPPSNLAVELVSGTTNSVKFTWAEVPSATNYKISKSIVAVGDGVGASGYIGDSTETQYIETVDSGHRYYYHVAAENRNQNSPASSDVFIDVN